VEIVLPFLLILIGFFVVFSPVLDAKFDLIDDHEILRFTADAPIHSIFGDVKGFSPPIVRDYILIERELSLGRFRPFYYVTRFVEIDVFGLNPNLWHLFHIMIGVFTATLLYMAARLAHIPRWISAGMVVFLTLQTTATEIWFKLGPAETQGMFLTSIAFYALVYGARKTHFSWSDAIALLALALAGWTKESFILITPALMLMRLGLCVFENQTIPPVKIFWRLFPLWLISGALFAFQLGFVLFVVRTNYARLGNDTYNPYHWFRLLGSLAGHNISFVPAAIGITITGVSWYQRRYRPKRLWLLISLPIFLILWIIPQFILYTNGFLGSRYVYPVVIGVILMNMLPLVTASIRYPRLTMLLVLPLMVIFGYGLMLDTHNIATRFSANTHQFNTAVTYMAKNIQPDDTIVIETNPVSQYERIISLIVFLGTAGVKSPIVLHFSDGDGAENNPIGLSFSNLLPNYELADTTPPEQAKFVIPLLSEDTLLKNPPVWFDEADYTRLEFSEEYSLWTVFWLPQPTVKSSFVVYERNE
jgi:hypothetical protein